MDNTKGSKKTHSRSDEFLSIGEFAVQARSSINDILEGAERNAIDLFVYLEQPYTDFEYPEDFYHVRCVEQKWRHFRYGYYLEDLTNSNLYSHFEALQLCRDNSPQILDRLDFLFQILRNKFRIYPSCRDKLIIESDEPFNGAVLPDFYSDRVMQQFSHREITLKFPVLIAKKDWGSKLFVLKSELTETPTNNTEKKKNTKTKAQETLTQLCENGFKPATWADVLSHPDIELILQPMSSEPKKREYLRPIVKKYAPDIMRPGQRKKTKK